MKKLLILGLFIITGCSDASISKITAMGKPHTVKCYSGGVLVYDGVSTGKVNNEDHSDGYYFEDSKTGKLVTVNANCIITVETK